MTLKSKEKKLDIVWVDKNYDPSTDINMLLTFKNLPDVERLRIANKLFRHDKITEAELVELGFKISNDEADN